MTCAVYVLADKSKRKSERELRLSLRSLAKNCKDLTKVYIVTDELPDWVQNVEHIKASDSNYGKPEKCVLSKLYRFTQNTQIQKFLFMNDDFFMMKRFNAKEYPYYYRGELVYIENPSRWQKVNNNTLDVLEQTVIDYGRAEKNDYGVHCPILYDRKSVQAIRWYVQKFEKQDSGVLFRSVYVNFLGKGIQNKIKVDDCKLWHGEPLRESDTGCISTADGADDVLDEIEKIFNRKCKYEK